MRKTCNSYGMLARKEGDCQFLRQPESVANAQLEVSCLFSSLF